MKKYINKVLFIGGGLACFYHVFSTNEYKWYIVGVGIIMTLPTIINYFIDKNEIEKFQESSNNRIQEFIKRARRIPVTFEDLEINHRSHVKEVNLGTERVPDIKLVEQNPVVIKGELIDHGVALPFQTDIYNRDMDNVKMKLALANKLEVLIDPLNEFTPQLDQDFLN